MSRRVGRGFCRGQALVELLALIPALLLVGALTWQLAVLAVTAIHAQERVRAEALARTAVSASTGAVEADVPVPTVLPGFDGVRVRVRVALAPR